VARVWDVQAKKIIHTLAHRNTVHGASYSRDGRLLVTGCADGKIQTWDTRTWTPSRTFTTAEPVNSQRIRSMALSPDGSLVAAGLINGTVHVWEVGSGKHLFEVNEHTREVEALIFTPDGKALVSAGHEQSLRLWNIAGGRTELILHGHEASVLTLTTTPDGNTIASADVKGNILLWQTPALDRIEQAEKRRDEALK
jgi:WD40 repeat protein